MRGRIKLFFSFLILITAAIVVCFYWERCWVYFRSCAPIWRRASYRPLAAGCRRRWAAGAFERAKRPQNRLRNCCGRLWNRLLPPA